MPVNVLIYERGFLVSPGPQYIFCTLTIYNLLLPERSVIGVKERYAL